MLHPFISPEVTDVTCKDGETGRMGCYPPLLLSTYVIYARKRTSWQCGTTVVLPPAAPLEMGRNAKRKPKAPANLSGIVDGVPRSPV